MDQDNANHLETIFFAALDIHDPAARASYLNENCGHDAELRQRIDQMLAIQSKVGSFMENPPVSFDGTIDLDKQILDAGLTAGLREDQAVVIGSANHSVLKSLSRTLNEMPRVMLRDPKEVGIDPIIRPRSKEIPADHVNSRYQLAGEIARGGMGAIIKGRDIDLGRDLAIKVLLDSHKDKPDVIQRFIEEAQIGGQLQHPGIVPVYELGQFGDERPFFSMKLVKGQTLAQVLGVRKHPSEDRAKYLGIFEQICQTMAYAHSRGVIHRDLKPANIMVGAFGEVQVMDWGLAKVLAVGGIADEKKSLEKQTEVSIIRTLRSVGSDSPGSLGSQTQMGSVMGTPAYMSPEQALGEVDRLDERTDVFGLGAILCEILTGKPPYVALSGEQVFRMASRGKLEDCYARLDASIIDPELLEIVRDALSLEPVDRLRDAGVLAERFSKYLESVESRLRQAEIDRATETARAEEALKTAAQELVTRKEAQGRVVEEVRRRRVTMALAASLLIGAIVSGWFAVHAGRQRNIAYTAQELAKQDRIVAELEREAAKVERNRAEAARTRAEGSEQTAIVERDKANAFNTELTKSKEYQRRMLYGAQMNLVQRAWDLDDAIQVQKLLNATRQRPGETDLRGIEWHYWQRMSHQEERVLKLPLWLSAGSALPQLNELPPGSKLSDGAAARTTFSQDGRRVAVIAAHVEDSQLVEILKVWNTESDSVEPIFSWNLSPNTGFALFAGTQNVAEAITDLAGLKATMASPSVSNRIVFLDAERVVIATTASKNSEDTRMLDILERRTNSTGQERKELDKERALLSNENRAALELQTFRLDSTLDAQLAQAHPPIKVQEGFAFNRDGSRIATHAIISKEGESRFQSTILILDGRTGEQIDQLPSPFPQARVLALSPDAARMVVAESISVPARDIEITILERATLNSIAVPLRDNNKRAPRFAFSPDGTRLAVDLGIGLGARKLLAILDAATGRELFSISNDASSVTSRGQFETLNSKTGDFVAFSPDGKWLVSNAASIDRATNVLKVWEAATGKLGTEFKGNTSRTIQAAFSADSKQLVVADQSGAIKVWRLPTKTVSELNENAARPLAVPNGDARPPERITARSSDRRWTASAPASSYYAINHTSANRSPTPAEPPFEIKLEDASGRVPPQILPLAAPAERLTFSPDGSFLEAMSVDESAKLDKAAELKVWSVATGNLAILPTLRFRATDRAFKFRMGPVLLQPFLQSLNKPHGSAWTFFSPDSRRLVCVFAPSDMGREQLAIQMWDLGSGRELPVALADPQASFLNSMNFNPGSLTFSSDSKLFLIANTRSLPPVIPTTGVRIMDAITGELRWAEDSPVDGPVFSSDASRLAGIRISTDVDGGLPSAAIVVWDAATGNEVGLIPLPPNHNVTRMPFLVNGSYELHRDHDITALAVSNKGSLVAATSPGSVTLYDVATATALYVLDGNYSNVWFAPDGQRVIAVYNPGAADSGAADSPPRRVTNAYRERKVWDVVTGQELMSRKIEKEEATKRSLEADQGTTTGLWNLPVQAEAEGLVDWLSAADGDGRFLTRSQIAEQIKTDSFVSAEARTIALKLVPNVRRSAEALSMQALKIFNSPTQPRDEYQQALEWINEAVEQANENSSYASYQGIAYYRLGQYADSQNALARSQELHAAQKLSQPAEDLTILAMAQHQTGQRDEARTTLEQARTSASRNKLTGQKLLAEAETLLGVPHTTDNP